jgi:uncharacterized protein (DUF885 family)
MKNSLLALAAIVACSTAAAAQGNFAGFVDRYLDRFSQYHPSIAAGNGLHGHDGELEDFSAPAIAKETAWLHGVRRDLDAFDEKGLTADQRVDRRILQGIVDGWLLDLETVRTWSRNPMIYVAAISDGLHDLAAMESAPAEIRLQRVNSKVRGIQRLIAAEKANVKSPPKVFVERAIAMLGGVEELLSNDLPLAFPDASVAEPLAARDQIVAFRKYLQDTVLPVATGSYAIGVANVEARYRAEELIDLPASQLLAIGERELARTQKAFTETAARIDPKRPALDVWRAVQDNHPARGQVVPAARAVVDELFAFIEEKQLVRLPADHRIMVAAAPAYDLGLASMHSSPPLEPKPVQSYYYITDADASWPLNKQNEWLRTFNYATLADISAHEVAPGHFVHSLYMRKTPGKVRRIWIGLNPFPQPSSGQDGWAHYAEQMVSEQGFKADDPRYRLAMLAESLNRLCRLIAGINLHSGKWTIDESAAFFQREAHLPPVAANRESVRGTYDPTYGGYALGKLAAYKLRRDYQQAKGSTFDLREFHERVMTDGIAPWWAHRQLLLPGDQGAVLE